MADSLLKAQYLRDRDTIQVRLDAILVAVEANRTIVDAMVADDAAVADKSDLIRRSLLFRCFTAAGLTIGSGDATKIKIANTVTFHNNGLLKSKTTAEFAFAETDVLAISSWRRYLISLAADGTPVATIGNDTTVNAAAALLPAVPADKTPIGTLLVATSSGGTFVPNTDDLSDAAVTDTYADAAWPDTGVDALVALGAIEETALGSTGLSALGAMQPF